MQDLPISVQQRMTMAGNGQSLPSGRALAACGKRVLGAVFFAFQVIK